jgi:hypothetical protein
MRRVLGPAALVLPLLFVPGAVEAGVPRGLMLLADEQSGDETTGVTIARGNAELIVEKRPIRGKADVIELHPKSNEVLLKGRATLAVGNDRYSNDMVICTLDFSHCTGVEPDQPLPDVAGGAGLAATANPR